MPNKEEEWFPFRESAARVMTDLAVPAEFIEAQKKSIVSEAKLSTQEPPSWAQRLMAKNATTQEIVEMAFHRALKVRNSQTLGELYVLVNEIGRDPQGAVEIRKHLTPENLARLLNKE